MEDVTYFLYKKTKFQLELAYESEKLGLYNLHCKIVFSGKTLVYNSEDPAKNCENLKLPAQNCKSGFCYGLLLKEENWGLQCKTLAQLTSNHQWPKKT